MNRSILVILLAIGALLTATHGSRAEDAKRLGAPKFLKGKSVAVGSQKVEHAGSRKGLSVPPVPVPGAGHTAPGAFKNVDGLDAETGVVELPGGTDIKMRKRPSRAKYGDVTLKKGYVRFPPEGAGPDGLTQKVEPAKAEPAGTVLENGAGKFKVEID